MGDEFPFKFASPWIKFVCLLLTRFVSVFMNVRVLILEDNQARTDTFRHRRHPTASYIVSLALIQELILRQRFENLNVVIRTHNQLDPNSCACRYQPIFATKKLKY